MTQIKERTLVSFDWAMKSILRDKANFDVLEGFLSALLGEEIQVLALLESEANQDDDSDKFNRVDLMVQDSRGVALIIEVQYSYASHYLRRLLFGTAKLITENIEVGDSYGKVKKVISISLLYFPLGESNGPNGEQAVSNHENEEDYVYRGRTEFYGIHTGKRLPVRQDTLQSVQAKKGKGKSDKAKQKGSKKNDPQKSDTESNIFPEYYLIDIEQFPDRVKSALDEWIYFFKHSDIPDEFEADKIQAAREKLNLMKMSAEARRAYERFWMARASYQDEIQSAHNEGLEEGRQEGRQEGLQEGRKEGVEEGRKESKLEIARQMLKNDVSLDNIQLFTGLSEDEIAQLRKSS